MTTRYSVCERIPQRFFTTDSRSRDAWLHAESTPRNPDMRGHSVWEGDLKPVGDAVARVKAALGSIRDRARLGDLLSRVVADIAEHGRELGMELDPTTGSGERPEKEFSVGEKAAPTLRNFQRNPASLAAFYADRNGQGASVTRDAPRRGPQTIAEINATNRAFHAQPQSLPYWRRPIGKG